MPIAAPGESSRTAVEALAVDGAVHVAVIRDAGTALPASTTLYSAVKGDGSGAVVKLETDGSGVAHICCNADVVVDILTYCYPRNRNCIY